MLEDRDENQLHISDTADYYIKDMEKMQEKGPKPKKMRFFKKTTNFSSQFLTINKNRVKIAPVV